MDEKLFVSRGGRVLRRMFPSLFGFIKALRLFFGHDSFLVKTGFLRSCAEGHPCRKDGTPLPWKNYAIIRFLEERLKPSLSMFEYGSGYSTLFFGASLVLWLVLNQIVIGTRNYDQNAQKM